MTPNRHHYSRVISNLKSGLLIICIQGLLLQPLIPILDEMLVESALAAADETSTVSTQVQYDSACSALIGQIYLNGGVPATASQDYDWDKDHNPDAVYEPPVENSVEDADRPSFLSAYANLGDIRKMAEVPEETKNAILNESYINDVMSRLGDGTGLGRFQQGEMDVVGICDTAAFLVDEDADSLIDDFLLAFNPFAPVSPQARQLTALLESPRSRIAFVNPLDRYYLLGEPCEGGLLPYDQWTDDPESPNPCPSFRPEDDVIANGYWDAPKVDKRVLETLLYLVTPVAQGGAGREHIRVKKLVQSMKDNPLDTPAAATPAPTESEDAALADSLFTNEAPAVTVNDGARNNDDRDEINPSSYWIDPNDPPHRPKRIATSVMIDQIDMVRVSTQTVEKRLLGNNTTRYTVQAPFPVEVAWQSDEGLASNPPPDFSHLSMLESSRVLINATVINMLNQYGLGDLELDVTQMNIDDFSDVALIVGQSLVEQLLGSPRGSLKGYDLLSVLKSIGLSYLEQELGLVPGSLADSNPLDGDDKTFTNFVRDIGRRTVEYTMGLPAGALRTATGSSNDILEAMGRASLESKVFRVSNGTLSPVEELSTVADLLERLGEGRIEQVFQLPKQSLRKTEYAPSDANASFRESSFKATLLFPKPRSDGSYTEDDYLMGEWVANKLSLSYVPYTTVLKKGEGGCEIDAGCPQTASTNMYGFTESDFEQVIIRLAKGEISLQKFKQLVGSRVVETSLGIFRREGARDGLPTDPEQYEQPVQTELQISGLSYNPRFQPVRDNYAGFSIPYKGGRTGQRIGYWCGTQERKTARGGNLQELAPGKTRIADLTREEAAKIIERIMDTSGSLNNQPFSGGESLDCEPDPSLQRQASFTAQVEDTVFSTEEIRRMVFLNQDQAPKIENLDHGDGGNYEGEDHGMGRFNVATMIFYNLPWNHDEVTVNGLSPYKPIQTSITTPSDGTEPATSAEPAVLTLGQFLDVLVAGGELPNDDSSYAWKADATTNAAEGVVSLQSRLDMLRSKIQSQGSLFDLASLRGDIPRAELNGLVIDRLNELTKRPAAVPDQAGSYLQQYQDPNYNGWLFLIQDLRERMRCKTKGGTYALNAESSGFACSNNTETLTADAKHYAEEALRLLDQLYRVPWTVTEELLNALNTGTVNDPTWNVDGGSMWSAATNLASQARRFASGGTVEVLSSTGGGTVTIPVTRNNWIFSKNDEESVYSQDLLRSLVAPRRTATGVVALDQSVRPFFNRYQSDMPPENVVVEPNPANANRSGLGEVGRIYAAKAFDQDALSERTFAAQLTDDFARAIGDVARLERAGSRFEDAVGVAKELVDESSQDANGLRNGDFSRIFQLDAANQVFERVGKEELLRTVWQRSGAAEAIKSSEQYQALVRQFRQLTDDINFYTTRLNGIQDNIEDLGDAVASLGTNGSRYRQEIQAIIEQNKPKKRSSLKDLQVIARSFEPVLSRVESIIRAEGNASQRILSLLEDTVHMAQEMVAGRRLPRQNSDTVRAVVNEMGEVVQAIRGGDRNSSLVGGRSDRSVDGACFDKERMIQVFSSGGNVEELLFNVAIAGGTCRAEQTVGLPSGSLLTWYQLGKEAWPPLEDRVEYLEVCEVAPDVDPITGLPPDPDPSCPPGSQLSYRIERSAALNPITRANLFVEDEEGNLKPKPGIPVWKKNQWTVQNFRLAVGLTVANQRREVKITLDTLHLQSESEIKRLMQLGDRTIQITVISRLSSLIPGFGQLLSQSRLTTADFTRILQGDMRPLIEKVGGTALDNALNLPRGTMGGLMYPECYDNNGSAAPCDRAPGQPGRDPDNVRAQRLAELGLRQLGLNVPGFPIYLDFKGKGTLADKWGNAVFSEERGLAINSFRGTITRIPGNAEACLDEPLWCQNSAEKVLKAFNLQNHPFAKGILAGERALIAQIQAEPQSGTYGGIATAVHIAKVTAVTRQLAKRLAIDVLSEEGVSSLYWNSDASMASVAVSRDRAIYQDGIQALWELTGGLNLTGPRLAAARTGLLRAQRDLLQFGTNGAPSLTQLETLDSLPDSIFPRSQEFFRTMEDRAVLFAERVRNSVTNLNDTYLGGGTDSVNFRRFLEGSITASEINERIAQSAGRRAVSAVMANLANDWIRNEAPGWLRDLDEGFRLLTDGLDNFGGSCGNGVGIGEFFTAMFIGTDRDCLRAISKISLDQLLTSTDANFVNARLYFFDMLLGQAFTNDLERSLGMTRGSLRAVIADPKNAQSILILEGVTMASDMIFGKDKKLNTCRSKGIDEDCVAITLENAAREALLAAFCDVYPSKLRPEGVDGAGTRPSRDGPRCSLNFQTDRAVSAFNAVVNAEFDRQLQRISKDYLGIQITRADLSRFVQGDMKYVPLLAMQFVTNQLIQTLFEERDEKKAYARFIAPIFNQVVSASGVGPRTPYSAIRDAQRVEALRLLFEDTNPDIFPANYFERNERQLLADLEARYVEMYAGASANGNVFIDEESARQMARDAYDRTLDERTEMAATQARKEAVEALKYAAFDIVAFKLDQNVPANFSRRLMSGDQQQLISALTQWGFNSIMNSNSEFGRLLTQICRGERGAENCFQQFKALADAIFDPNSQQKMQAFYASNDGYQFITTLDSVLTRYFQQKFGISLPPNVFEGIYVWGMHGFKSEDFNKEYLSSVGAGGCPQGVPGCRQGVPIGRIMQGALEQRLFDWGDKTLGLKPGTVAKAAQVVRGLIELQKLSARYARAVAELRNLQFLSQDWITKANEVSQLKKAMNELKVTLARVVADIVVSQFSAELQELDGRLGLPPGTMALLATAAITYGASLALGLSGSAATAAAFGPAFFIALGIQVVFGVVKVEVRSLGTADGYYPFYSSMDQHGSGPATRCIGKSAGALGGCTAQQPYWEHYHPSRVESGRFDVIKSVSYRAGLKAAAREKVRTLLLDLIRMQDSRFAKNRGIEPVDLFPLQVFTYGGFRSGSAVEQKEFDPTYDPELMNLLVRPAPWSGLREPAYGFGSLEERCDAVSGGQLGAAGQYEELEYVSDSTEEGNEATFDNSGADPEALTCLRKPSFLSGYYGIPQLIDAVHVRF